MRPARPAGLQRGRYGVYQNQIAAEGAHPLRKQRHLDILRRVQTSRSLRRVRYPHLREPSGPGTEVYRNSGVHEVCQVCGGIPGHDARS